MALILALIFAFTLGAVNPLPVKAQSGLSDDSQVGTLLGGGLFGTDSELFANDGRIKVLVLGLNPFGLTESAAEQIGLILQKNLANTGHFDVVGPREMNAALEKSQPDLVDCREIACGVESGKLVRADRVLVATLRLEDPIFILQIRFIDTTNNLTDYEEEIRFTDTTMDEDLFQLSHNVSRNSLLEGRVLNTSIRGIVISLGNIHGIQLGDHIVIYKKEVPITDLEGKQIDTQRKNVAIVKVLNVNENSSEAILVHKTEEPQVGQYAHTYEDQQRQIALVEHTRKELDTGIRLSNRIRPLELAPVALADSDRRRWEKRLAQAEGKVDTWLYVMIGGAAGGVYFLSQWTGSTFDLLGTAAAGGAIWYGFREWSNAKSEINGLKVLGRSRGYLSDTNNSPYLAPGGGGLLLSSRF